MKRPARIVAGVLVFAYFVLAPVAQSHLVRVPDHPARSVLENREASQIENLLHARYVARHGGGVNQRWHRVAARWIAEELLETQRLLRPPVRVIPEPWYSIAVCESGLGTGRPNWHINTGNGFFGGLQFLTSTWLAYGGGRYASRADLAAPWQQVRIASGMSLSHWPVCGRPYR